MGTLFVASFENCTPTHPALFNFFQFFRPLNAGEAESRFFSNFTCCVRKKCAHSIKYTLNKFKIHAVFGVYRYDVLQINGPSFFFVVSIRH